MLLTASDSGLEAEAPAAASGGLVAKVADFGYAQRLQSSRTHTTLSRPGGTISHIAPELLSSAR